MFRFSSEIFERYRILADFNQYVVAGGNGRVFNVTVAELKFGIIFGKSPNSIVAVAIDGANVSVSGLDFGDSPALFLRFGKE